MKLFPSFLLGLSGSALALAIALAGTPATLAARQAPMGGDPNDPAIPVFAQTCIKCHDGARILAARRTKMEWEEIIKKMIEKGATGSGDEFETVYDYLVRTYGKAYVNTAPAAEIAQALNLSEKDADAIVAYRTANGPFADPDAIKKVPGIDVKVLDAHVDAIAF